MTDDDAIPVVEHYRGVGLHDEQSPKRLEVVRRAIDKVFEQQEIAELMQIAGDPTWPPEARLLAGAKLKAMHQVAVDERRERPPINLTRVNAMTPGLDLQKWRHPRYYASLLDPGPAPGKSWVKRERPLRK
jgi:hypothetical protein